MRMRYSWKDDKQGKGVSMAFPVAVEPTMTVDLTVLNCISNKSRDNAWKIGDQAMKKGDTGAGSGITRGCFA